MKIIFFRVVVSVFCISWLSKNIIFPVATYLFYKDKYVELSSSCANAMDETWFAEQYEGENIKKSSEVHLLVCHEYDKTRKIMLLSGLNESVLSYLGLKALEIDQHSAEELVKQHRFKER